jgi:hypothetical protein
MRRPLTVWLRERHAEEDGQQASFGVFWMNDEYVAYHNSNRRGGQSYAFAGIGGI